MPFHQQDLDTQRDSSDPAHRELRRSLALVLEKVLATTHEVDVICSRSPSRQSLGLAQSSSARHVHSGVKGAPGDLDAGIDRIILKPSFHLGRRQTLNRLSADLLGQGYQGEAAKEMVCTPPIATLPSPRSIFPNAGLYTQATSGESMFPWPPIINHSACILPSPISPGTAIHSASSQNCNDNLNTDLSRSQNLQGEHDDLAVTLARAEKRIAILGRKCRASDAEISSLKKGNSILRAQVYSLESQLQRVQQSRDEAQQHSSTKDAQYVDIVAMASKMQAQSHMETQKWRAQKSEWEQEKQVLLQRLGLLSHEREARS